MLSWIKIFFIMLSSWKIFKFIAGLLDVFLPCDHISLFSVYENIFHERFPIRIFSLFIWRLIPGCYDAGFSGRVGYLGKCIRISKVNEKFYQSLDILRFGIHIVVHVKCETYYKNRNVWKFSHFIWILGFSL